jgi:hypothetical protein
MSMTSTIATTTAGFLLLLVAGGAAACASTGHIQYGPRGDAGGATGDDGPGTFTGQDGGDTGTFGTGTTGGNCNTLQRGCSSACTDFPHAPVIDAKPDDGSPPTPSNAPSYFSAADGSGAAPCLVDPEAGTLVPQNWLRPRIRVIPASGQNLFEITLHTQRQADDYVVYTTSKTWKMPKAVWDGLRADSWGDAITVKVRGVDTTSGSPAPTSATSSFTIAPASAGGAMIYWAATGDQNGLSWLEGFAPGDESVATTLEVPQVQAKLFRDQGGNIQNGGAVQCIGCHAAVPDGDSVTFVDFWPWPGSTASVNPKSTGAVPSWLTPGGAHAVCVPWIGIAAFSKSGWANETVAITSYGCAQPTAGNQQSYPWSGATCSDQPTSSLAWVDLAAAAPAADASSGWQLGQDIMSELGQSFGFLARNGDTRGAEFPNWSHDGTTIVYVSTNAGKDGRLGSGAADLYTVPYNARKGGTATALQGASDPSASEYYPAYSADDKLVAFDRATTQGANGMYYNPGSEVYVVPASGAPSPTRLAANDPPACQGTPGSPGVTNSWPKWSPDVESCPDGNTYYWIVFSSTREGTPFNNNGTNFKSPPDGPTSQLYITGVVVAANGKVTTYPALYIWNQATKSSAHNGDPQSNHTPIWEVVNIPRPPPPQ